MTSVTKATVYRFLVWTAIGQVLYFSYGFWYSKRRKLFRNESNLNRIELLPTISNAMEQHIQNEVELDLASEDTE
ncbi:unnamed protein product, partial [Rotaria sp. Silwood2]